MELNLTHIKVNQVGVVRDVIDNPLITKMLEFGVLPGANFKVVNIAPFNGPISVLLENTRIAIRRNEAKFILVEG